MKNADKFINTFIEVSNGRVQCKSVTDAYLAWCGKNGRAHIGVRVFEDLVLKHFRIESKKKVKGQFLFIGIALKTNHF